MLKTFRYRLYPTSAQATAMQHTLNECRWLYNHLLEERKTAWDARGETVGYYDQNGAIPPLKAERVTLKDVHSQVLQDVAVRLDLAFKAFFRRVKAGQEPGYPRFRGWGHYDSFCYPQKGYRLDGARVFLSKIGHVRAVIHRPLEGKAKTCCVRRTATGTWFATFACEVEDAPLPATDSAIGIDVGLASFATMSDGLEIANPRFFRRDEQALATAQRRLSTEPRPETGQRATPERRRRRRVVARIYERIANRRKDFAHQQSRRSSTPTASSPSKTSPSTAWSTITASPRPFRTPPGPCSSPACRTRLQAPVGSSPPSIPPIPRKRVRAAAIARN